MVYTTVGMDGFCFSNPGDRNQIMALSKNKPYGDLPSFCLRGTGPTCLLGKKLVYLILTTISHLSIGQPSVGQLLSIRQLLSVRQVVKYSVNSSIQSNFLPETVKIEIRDHLACSVECAKCSVHFIEIVVLRQSF